ncbi:MAG: tyrosine-protein phosphatase [Clostridia bacterium]|nr:tyrosine-protein phosphatase [Clostridia bacterium]
MASLLKSTLNTRFLPGSGERFIRSDAPVNLTENEIGWLEEQNIRTLVDLRSEEEAERKPCPLKDRKGFMYHHLPVTGGGDTPKSREHLHHVYAGMVDGQMEKIIRTILAAETKVLYFCTAGKDRTGVVSALLMKRMGCDEKEIIADYMTSRENLMDMLTAYVAGHPEVKMDIIVPREENMERLLHSLG